MHLYRTKKSDKIEENHWTFLEGDFKVILRLAWKAGVVNISNWPRVVKSGLVKSVEWLIIFVPVQPGLDFFPNAHDMTSQKLYPTNSLTVIVSLFQL